MNPRISHDTSHYAECATLMQRYRQNHLRRVVALAILLLANFYLHVLRFGTKYAGESIASVMYANDGKAVNPIIGIGGMILTVLLFVGGLLLFKFCKNNKIRFGYVIGAVAVMGIFTIGNQQHAAQNTGAGVSHLAFGMGMMTLFLSVGVLAAAFFAEHTRPKLLIVVLVILILGFIGDFFGWMSAVPAILLYLIAIPEYRKMAWMRKQPGYPYFNERFDEANEHREYEPLHKLDHRSYAEMADLDGNTSDAAFAQKEREHRAETQRIRCGEMDYTLKISDNPAEMPGIEDIFEKTEPLPEPEVPDANAIPDPVWNEPAAPASTGDIPDTKWDMPDTNWDVPDISSDIPDLPEIPDIPKL